LSSFYPVSLLGKEGLREILMAEHSALPEESLSYLPFPRGEDFVLLSPKGEYI
jgi:hypothetical protein